MVEEKRNTTKPLSPMIVGGIRAHWWITNHYSPPPPPPSTANSYTQPGPQFISPISRYFLKYLLKPLWPLIGTTCSSPNKNVTLIATNENCSDWQDFITTVIVFWMSSRRCTVVVVRLSLCCCRCAVVVVVVRLSLCGCRCAVVVVRLSLCGCRCAVVVVSLCCCRCAVVVVLLSLCCCRCAVVVVLLSLCCCRCAVVVVRLSLCGCRCAVVVVRLSLCGCRCAVVVVRLSLCGCRCAVVVVLLSLYGCQCNEANTLCSWILFYAYISSETHVNIHTTHRLPYHRETLQFFAYIPWTIWSTQHLTDTLTFSDHCHMIYLTKLKDLFFLPLVIYLDTKGNRTLVALLMVNSLFNR